MTADTYKPEAVLAALVLVPHSLSRNRFYSLYEDPQLRRVRRRAKRLRGVIRQLTGKGREQAELLGTQVLDDERVLLRFRVHNLAFQRTVSLSPLEAALINYALHRADGRRLHDSDKQRVEDALRFLGAGLDLDGAAD